MQAVMLEKVHNKVPNECGWFEAPHHCDDSDVSSDEDVTREMTKIYSL